MPKNWECAFLFTAPKKIYKFFSLPWTTGWHTQEAEDLLKKLSVKSGSFIARPYGKLLSFARLVYSNFEAIMVLTPLSLSPPFPPVPERRCETGCVDYKPHLLGGGQEVKIVGSFVD